MTKATMQAVEEFTADNLTGKLYKRDDMQDAFLIGYFRAEKDLLKDAIDARVVFDFSDPADVICRKLLVDKDALSDALLKLDIGEATSEGLKVKLIVYKEEKK